MRKEALGKVVPRPGKLAPAFSSDTGTDFGCGRARGPGRLACAIGSLSSNRHEHGIRFYSRSRTSTSLWAHAGQRCHTQTRMSQNSESVRSPAAATDDCVGTCPEVKEPSKA